MYSFKTLKSPYFDEKMDSSLRYNKKYVASVASSGVITKQFKHDLFKAYVDDLDDDIIYMAINVLNAKILRFRSHLRCLLLQKFIVRTLLDYYSNVTLTEEQNYNTPDNLQRFLDAQQCGYKIALQEIKEGHKDRHWIWYIFPQIQGLGDGFKSQKYAISGLSEAQQYLEHPILGARLLEVSEAILVHSSDVVPAFLGYPDDLKLRSCMTLFAHAVEDGRDEFRTDPRCAVFRQVLNKFYNGEEDNLTLEILRKQNGNSSSNG